MRELTLLTGIISRPYWSRQPRCTVIEARPRHSPSRGRGLTTFDGPDFADVPHVLVEPR